MVTKVTNGIEVTVSTAFQEGYSRPDQNDYLFSYRISIQNKSDYTVQLMRRHWKIFDSCGQFREVEGEGVVGQQPVLAPGEHYEYESACNLTTDMGTMRGTYTMRRETDNARLVVQIPEFQFVAPYRQN